MHVRYDKTTHPKEKQLLWISCLYLDTFFHKTSRIEVLEALARRGYKVTLFVARSRKDYVFKNSLIKTVQVPLRHVPALSSILFTGIVLLFLPYYILSKKPTHIVTDPNITILGFLGASILCKLARIKIVLDLRSTPVEVSGIASRFLAFFFGVSVLLARRVFDGMTVITTLMKNEVCDKFRIDRSYPAVWTSGVSKTLFDPSKYRARGSELRKSLGIDTYKFVVFYHGSFSQKRGLLNCIKCIKLLKNSADSISGVVLFLLGSGNALSAIKEEVARCGVEDSVVIHDPVDYTEVPAYIAMCDVAISALPNLPDWRYQSPLNVLEYLSMEKAVIATDIPAHRQIMGDSKCAIYAGSAHPRELAKAIGYAYENRRRLMSFGVCGRQIVDERYTWDKVSENFDKYLIALSGNSSRSR
jgi:glycosyltransferase involved in cell wall biosynthesis